MNNDLTIRRTLHDVAAEIFHISPLLKAEISPNGVYLIECKLKELVAAKDAEITRLRTLLALLPPPSELDEVVLGIGKALCSREPNPADEAATLRSALQALRMRLSTYRRLLETIQLAG